MDIDHDTKEDEDVMQWVIAQGLLKKFKDWDDRQEFLTTLGQNLIDRCQSLSLPTYRYEKHLNIELRDLARMYQDNPSFLKRLGEQIIKKAAKGETKEDQNKLKRIKEVWNADDNR
jgi:hypothetical protein